MSDDAAQSPPDSEAQSSSPAPPKSVIAGQGVTDKVQKLLNEARAGKNLRNLKFNPRLVQAAQEHSEDMVRRGYFNYTAADGSEGIEARVRKLGYQGRIGVNLGRSRMTPEEAVQTWLADPTTLAGIVDPDHYEFGVGLLDGVWTLLLGTPEQVISDPLRGQLLELVNKHRASYSIPPVELNPQLNYVAQKHCLDMANRGYFGGASPEGKDVTQRAAEVDYKARVCDFLAEAPTPEEALAKWTGNAALNSQLLNAENRCMGAGLFAGKWVMILGLPAATAVVVQKSASELKSDLGSLVNVQRGDAKAPPLRWNPTLEQIVEGHAADMAAKNFLAYEHPGVLGITGRIKESGYKGRVFPAITKGQTSADAVLKLFLGSEGHRKNLLDPQFRDFAIASKDGAWVLLLGAPNAEAGPEVRGELLKLINAQRAASSAPALAQSSLLNSVAQDFAHDMARRDFFAFTNPEGKGPDALAKGDGFPGKVMPAIAKGASTPEAVLAGWMKSPQNRASLLDPQYTLIGIGVAETRWVLLLGTAST